MGFMGAAWGRHELGEPHPSVQPVRDGVTLSKVRTDGEPPALVRACPLGHASSEFSYFHPY